MFSVLPLFSSWLLLPYPHRFQCHYLYVYIYIYISANKYLFLVYAVIPSLLQICPYALQQKLNFCSLQDERIESDQSDGGHSLEDNVDLSSINDIGDLPVERGCVVRHYIHCNNRQLNWRLNAGVMAVLVLALGIGLGHWIGLYLLIEFVAWWTSSKHLNVVFNFLYVPNSPTYAYLH